MSIKNLRFYTVDTGDINDILKNDTTTEEKLNEVAFRPCAKDELSSVGFVPVFDGTDALHFSCGNNHFFKVAEEAKILPSSTVKREIKNVILVKENELKRTLKKSEKDAIKAAVANKLLSQALTSYKEFLIWLNPKEKIVGVATTSAKKAEGAIALLRAAFTTFPAQLLSPQTMPELVMTEWLKNPLTLPEIFHFGNDTTLKSTDEDGATIKASKEDLTSEEISIHLDSKVVKEISLHYDITADIKLTSDLVIKSFKPVDLYLEKTLPEKSDNPVADAQALLIIEADILASLCPKLLEVFKCKVD